MPSVGLGDLGGGTAVTDIGSSSGVGASGSSGGGGDMTSELGALLSSVGDDSSDSSNSSDTSGQNQDVVDASGGDAADQSGQTPVTGDDAAQPTLDADGQPQPDANAAAEPIPGWKLNEDGTYSVPATELPRVQGALQYADAVSQYFNTPQDAQFAASTASQFRQMQNDWTLGSPDAIKGVLNFLSGGDPSNPNRATFQRSFAQAMSMAPDYLQQSNPQAYSSLVSSFTNRIVESNYLKAANIAAQYGAESIEAKTALIDAQAVEYGITGGRYRTELPKVDPQAQARSQFEQQQRSFQQQQDAAFQRDVTAFTTSSLDGAEKQQLSAAIDAKLAAVKESFEKVLGKDATASTFADMRDGMYREVINELKKNEDWFTEHTQTRNLILNKYRETWNSGSPGNGLTPLTNSHIADFMSRANRVLTPIAQKRINAATQTRVAAVNGRNRNANGQFQPVSPSASASATRPNQSNGANNGRNGQNGQPNGNQPRQSRSDQFDKEWSSEFAQFRR